METFSIRELRTRTGDLSRSARQGEMSLITSHGKPLAIALPFDDELLEAGVHISLAVRMFEQQHVSLASGAKIARKSVEDFIVILGESGVDAVQYDAAELERDLAHIG